MNKFIYIFFITLILSLFSATALLFNDLTISATESNTIVEIRVNAEADSLIYNNNSINFTNLYQDFRILRNDLLFIDQTDSYHNYSFSDGAYYIFEYKTAQTTCKEKINLIIEQYRTFAELFGLLFIVSIGMFMLKSMEDNNTNSIKDLKEIGKVIIIVAIMIVIAIIALLQFGGNC